MAAAVIRTIAAAADAGTCALKSPEIDSGEDGGVNVCTDWPVLATNFKGYGSTGKDGRAALERKRGMTCRAPTAQFGETMRRGGREQTYGSI